MGHPALSLQSWQIGIMSCGPAQQASIDQIQTTRLLNTLDDVIPMLPGFRG